MSMPRPEYPRPDFARETWLNLNGDWSFAYDDANAGLAEKWYRDAAFPMTITVPYCYQSPLSGIGDASRHDVVWYRRAFEVPTPFAGKRVMLRFGAVDHTADVWVNGQHCGRHTGGYTPFSLDITDLVKRGENTLVVRAEDDGEATDQLRGKQRWMDHNYGCWYTPVTGIWQTVWLEAVPALFIEKVRMTPDMETVMLRLEAYLSKKPSGETLTADVSFQGAPVASVSVKAAERVFRFDIDLVSSQTEWKLRHWSPENPSLYDVTFTLGGDRVQSYFGLRKVGTRGNRVFLNERPLYQRLILNQGYYDGGLYTARDDADFVRDIELIKSLGFNGMRIHQKLEDPRLLYWCDRLGMIVWSEMASAYTFDDRMVAENTRAWQEAIERDFNHPSIIAWTLMNESWGIPRVLTDARQQAHATALYNQAKALDPTRLAISNDGWEHTVSDIVTLHDYAQDGGRLAKIMADAVDALEADSLDGNGLVSGGKHAYAEGHGYAGEPVLLSECCGTAFTGVEGWGYGQGVADVGEYMARYAALIGAVYAEERLCGFCVTQLTDVEQEVNGLLTIGRAPKMDVAAFAKIIRNEKET